MRSTRCSTRCPDTVICLTVVATPQDVLEAHLNHLSKKSVGETLASEQTRRDVQEARGLIGSAHKLYRGALAFYLRGRDLAQLDARGLQLVNVMLNAGLQPVREEDEVAPLNSYLRWLPCVFDPAADKRQWYTQLMFAQHAANLAPVWGRSQGTGNPGITFFNRGGGPITFDPLNRLDRQMNAHLFLFGPTGSGKSATLNNILNQVTAIYRPRLFIVEAGNSFGLFGDFAARLGMKVHRVKLAPGAGVSLAPFADAHRLVETPSQVQTLDADALDEDRDEAAQAADADEQRDVLGELEITARLMITGGEDKEEARMTRADRSLIRQCILDAAQRCVADQRTVLTRDVRDALRERARDTALPRCGARGCWKWPTRWICSARAWTARCSTGPARLAGGRHHHRRSGDLRTRGLQRAAFHRLHQPHQYGQQHRRARPVPRPADHQRDGRGAHHHQEPAARALRREDHEDVAQARRLVLAGDAEHRRPAQGRRAHAEHDRVVDLPLDAARRGGEDRALPRAERGAEGADAVGPRRPASSARA